MRRRLTLFLVFLIWVGGCSSAPREWTTVRDPRPGETMQPTKTGSSPESAGSPQTSQEGGATLPPGIPRGRSNQLEASNRDSALQRFPIRPLFEPVTAKTSWWLSEVEYPESSYVTVSFGGGQPYDPGSKGSRTAHLASGGVQVWVWWYPDIKRAPTGWSTGREVNVLGRRAFAQESRTDESKLTPEPGSMPSNIDERSIGFNVDTDRTRTTYAFFAHPDRYTLEQLIDTVNRMATIS